MLKKFTFQTTKKYEIVDVTSIVQEIVKESEIKEGICVVYVPHATAAVIINENYDPNISDDLLDSLKENIPEGKWRHDRVDGNAAAHIKSSIVGPSETLIIKDGKLLLGTWQNLMVADFDGPKNRNVIVKIISD
ncbi:MAG: hypothetical protein MAG795_00764 [Candidatus Woesearchaeota archaeon]|nr:hypothetical protein [Candidatus Woesearchaeota archaeon]